VVLNAGTVVANKNFYKDTSGNILNEICERRPPAGARRGAAAREPSTAPRRRFRSHTGQHAFPGLRAGQAAAAAAPGPARRPSPPAPRPLAPLPHRREGVRQGGLALRHPRRVRDPDGAGDRLRGGPSLLPHRVGPAAAQALALCGSHPRLPGPVLRRRPLLPDLLARGCADRSLCRAGAGRVQAAAAPGPCPPRAPPGGSRQRPPL
jgi:hypothetical protein